MNSEHSFNIIAAQELGIEKSILLGYISYWCRKNEVNGKNIFDGKAYTYNTYDAFEELFPYMKSRTIRKHIKELEDDGYIESRNDINDNKWDKTKWYHRTDKQVGIELTQNVTSESQNMSDHNNEQFIHNSNAVHTQDAEDAIFNAWNNLASNTELSKIQSLTKSRKSKLKTRFKDFADFDTKFIDACEKIMQSSFLMGKNSNGWKITFDWIIDNDSNIIKVLEGNYDSKKGTFDISGKNYNEREDF